MSWGFSTSRRTQPAPSTSATPKRRGSFTSLTQATASACSWGRKEKSASMMVSTKTISIGPARPSRASHSAWDWPSSSSWRT